MPKKGQRTVRKCTQCDKQVREQWHNGKLKGYHKTCEDHFNYHHKPGAQHHNATKGGRRLTPDGYVHVLDPQRKTAKKSGSNYRPEHRLVMEKKIGRKLKRNEIVHHINGIRDDNRPENLALIGPKEKHESRTLIKALQKRIRELELKLSRLAA